MPITIKELLASDTISQAADKINFNFDQLILNGGGPEGPVGPQGPIGPIGGRGKRGSLWYEDPNGSPGTNPNTIIFADLLEGDNYLQSDGTVWEYNGTVWVTTPVNLTGPQGATGVSAGFGYFGQILPVVGENTIYPLVMPSGGSGGANVINEGVPSLMVGGVVSSTQPVTSPSTIPFTNAYEISNSLAQSIGSNVTSLFIHQKDSSSTAITFHGGAAVPTDKFEISNISNLSTIGLGEDDKLKITVPKPPTTPSGPSDLVGLEINTTNKSQQYFAGKAINFYTGIDPTLRIASEISDFDVQINQSNASIPPKFSVSVASPNSILQLGGSITLPGNPSVLRTGKFLLSVQDSEILTSGVNSIISTGAINIRSNNSNVNITATTGVINNNAINIQNTATSGIANDVTGIGNITHTIVNGAFSSRSGAGIGNPTNIPLNLTGWSYLYARNGIDLNANAAGSQIILSSQGSIGLTAVTQNITLSANAANVQVNALAGQIDLTGLRVNISATGGTSGLGGRIVLNTSLDDINIFSGRDVNIDTGASRIFDVDAGTIDMFSTANTTINAGGSSSILSLISGNNITLDATSGVNGIIQINSKSLDINVSNFITLDSPSLTIGGAGTNIITTIQSNGFLILNATNSGGNVNINSSTSRPNATPGISMPPLGLQINAEISPINENLSGSVGVIVTRQNPAITSGSFSYSLAGVVNYCTMNWIKIGAIVHVNGILEYADNTPQGSNLGAIPLPIILNTTNGNDIGEFYGHGTAYIKEYTPPGVPTLTYNAKMIAVELKQGITSFDKNYFIVTYQPNVIASGFPSGGNSSAADSRYLWVQRGDGNPTNPASGNHPIDNSTVIGWDHVLNRKANIRFSFSYRLDN